MAHALGITDSDNKAKSKNMVLPANSMTRIQRGLKAIKFAFSEPTVPEGGLDAEDDIESGSIFNSDEIRELQKVIKSIGYKIEHEPSDYYCYYLLFIIALTIAVPFVILTFQSSAENSGTLSKGTRLGIYGGVISVYLLIGLFVGWLCLIKFRASNKAIRRHNYAILMQAIARVKGSPDLKRAEQLNELQLGQIFVRCQL